MPPIIKGCSDYTPIVNTYLLKNESGSWAFIENEEYYSTSFLVMGGVPYKISSINITGLDGLHSKMLENNIVLFANIGDVTINSAREEVSYTPKSIAYIKAALRSVEAEAKGEIDKKFANCASEYEVKKLYFQCFGGGTLSNVIHKTFNYKKIVSLILCTISFGKPRGAAQTALRHIKTQHPLTFTKKLSGKIFLAMGLCSTTLG